MDTVLVLFETTDEFRQKLFDIFKGYNIVFNEKNDAIYDEKSAENVTVILGNLKSVYLKHFKRLKWMQLTSAGANEYINGELSDPVRLTCATGCYGHAVSEHMLAMTLELMKKLHLYRDGQPAGSWQSRGRVMSIQGSVTLVIGCGDIGLNYARRMKALGSHVIGIDRYAYAKPDCLDEIYLPEKTYDALKRADVVALAVPGTKDTAKLIGRQQFAMMKKEAILINACRGTVVDTEALCDALESGALGAAGLDVTDPEPLPPEHRLWKFENAVITPHVAGGRHLQQTIDNIMNLCLENSRRFLNGQPLESLVDYKTGFKKPAPGKIS